VAATSNEAGQRIPNRMDHNNRVLFGDKNRSKAPKAPINKTPIKIVKRKYFIDPKR
jgi:hypothetical protein